VASYPGRSCLFRSGWRREGYSVTPSQLLGGRLRPMAGVYRFPTAWQDEHPFGSGAHWEVGWSEEQLSFFARLIEEYTEDEIEAGLLQPAAEPVFSYGEGFGEITDTDLLAYEMQEAIRPDIELALIRDQVESLKRLSAEELERRIAEARHSAFKAAH
jgi:hypothetical protein